MTLVPHDITKLGKVCNRNCTDNYLFLTEFLNGSNDCVRLANYSQASAKVCAQSMRTSVNRYYKGQVKVIQRGDDVYLAKATALNK